MSTLALFVVVGGGTAVAAGRRARQRQAVKYKDVTLTAVALSDNWLDRV